jgi:hypothetical protein
MKTPRMLFAALIAVLTITLSLAAQVPDSGLAVIKSIGYAKTDAGLEISVSINGVFVHKTSVLSSPNRLVIDVSPARRIEASPAYEVNAFGVTKIRTGQFKRRVSRVILDFNGTVPPYDVQKTGSGLVVKIGIAPEATEKIAAPAVAPPPVIESKPAEDAAPAVSPAPGIEKKSAEDVKPAPKEEVVVSAPETEGPAMPAGFCNTTIGFLIGSYKSPDSRFREVYGNKTAIQYGIDLSRSLFYYKGVELDASLEARTFSTTGKATLSGDEAKFSMIPLTVAGRILVQTKYITPFVGAGGDWYHYKEESVLANTSGWASGFHAQGGVFIVVPGADFLRVKLYYKYTKVTATANEISVKLGGSEYGLGLSFGFNFLNGAAIMVR